MFKCSKNYLFLLLALVLSPSVFADVHKWKDANGKTHYGDAPPVAGTATVKTDKQTDDQIENGRKLQSETTQFVAQEERERRAQEQAQAKEEKAAKKKEENKHSMMI